MSAGIPCIGAIIGVSIVPGATTFTRMPSLAHFTASVLVRAMIPALAALYPVDPTDISADLVELAGADALVARAQAHLDADRPVQAIHLAEKVTDTDPDHPGARAVLKAAHERLLADSDNFWETAWLRKQIASYA